ncbi:MAG TPA: AAA family ATPase [Kribbella sp.]|nr:AAA family ATPase [Kribbella sp.]
MSGRISSPTLIGRDFELAELWGAWERASSGTPAVLLVGGEAGVGKTRLVNEFSSQIRDGLVLQGACIELGRMMLPFAPLVTILRQLSRTFGAEKARDLYGAELGRFVGVDDAAGGTEAIGTVMPEQFDALIAVRSLFGRLAARSPVVVVLEDLHWAGRSTLDLLSFLARNLDDLPMLIVGTYRSDELRRTHPLRPVLAELGRLDHVERLELAPLGETELIRLVTAIRGTQPEPAVLSTILDRAEGNPFFAEELLATTPAGTSGIPTTLTDIIGVRLERLGAEGAEVVRIAAAAGCRMDHRLLEQVWSMRSPDLETGLRDAVQQDVLVVEGDGYRFRHSLVQEVAHGQLLPGERIRLHAAFADVLARDPELAAGGAAGVHAELAHHALEAHEVDRAFTSLVLAARHEQQLSAHAEAERHLAVAVELYDRLSDETAAQAPPLTELLSGAALSARYGGDPGAGVAFLRRAISSAETTDDPLLTGELYTELSESLWMSASGDAALAASDRSIEILPPQPTRERAAALGWRARLLMLHGRSREAVAPGQEAVAIARKLVIPLELSRALNALGTSLRMIGAFDEGRRMLEESIEIAARIGAGVDVVRGYINTCSTLSAPYDDVAGSERVALEGLAYAEHVGVLVPVYDWLRLELVDALIRQGRWAEAEEHIGRVRFGSVSGIHGERYQSTVAALRIRQGRLDEAERHLLIAEASAPAIRDPQAVVSQLDVRLRLLLARGQPEQAAAVVPEDLLASDEPMVASLFPVLARCAAEAGLSGDSGARKWGGALEGLLADRMGWKELGQAPYESTKRWSHFVRAELSRLDGSDPDVWQTALAAMRRSVHADFELEAQLRLAEALATVGDTDAARSELSAAYARASAIGAAGQVAEIEASARRHRIRLPGSAAGAEPVIGLTAREVEVLRLVAEGRTNREIGARLYISQKTASVHVSNIMAKLEVTNRSEAGAKARRLGLDGAS